MSETLPTPPTPERRQQLKAMAEVMGEGNGSFKAMNERQEAAIEASQQAQALAEKANTPKVQALNDKAELEIYGSNGRTYTNPDTGDIIASPTKPLTGKLEEIRNNPRYGKTQAERERAARWYEEDIKDLSDQGLELSQIKLVQDLREGEWGKVNKLAVQYMASGMGGQTALNRARKFYERLDDARVKFIKEKGIYTADEYDEAREVRPGKQPPAEASDVPEPSTPPAPEIPPAVPTPNQYEQPIGPQLPEATISPEVLQKIEESRQAYADLTARRRRTSSFSKQASEKKLAVAQEAYEDAVDGALGEIEKQLTDAGVSKVAAQNTLLKFKVPEALELQQEIFENRERLAKRHKLTGRFYDWWARQGGADKKLKGAIKKAAAMAGIGAATGLAVGAVVGTAGLGLVGAAATAAGARGIARGLARAKIEKGANETVALKQWEAQSEALESSLRQAYHQGDWLQASHITRQIESSTKKEVKRNRARMAGSVALGAVFGFAGGTAGHFIHEALQGGTPASIPGVKPSQPQPPKPPLTPLPKAPEPVPSAIGHRFYVEHGSGIINEIGQYADAHGRPISPERATEIYQHLHQRFGRNIIDLIGTKHDTYMYGSDVRLSQPGAARWSPHVERMLRDELKKTK